MKGFSVAQLLIVLGIIVITSAVTFPALSGYIDNLELKNATKQVVVNLKLAQQLALTEQIKYAVNFEILTTSYALIKRNNPDIIINSFNLPDGIFFSSQAGLNDDEVVYNAGGSVDYSGEIYLTHQQTLNQTVINVKPSGYITWQTYVIP